MPEKQHTEKVTKNLSFRIALDLWKRLGIYARKRETSVQSVIIEAVEEYLSKNDGTVNGGKPESSAPSGATTLETFLTKNPPKK